MIASWSFACLGVALQAFIPWDWPLWHSAAATLNTDVAGTWSLNPTATLNHLPKLIMYGLVGWLGFALGQNPHDAKRCCWGLGVAGVGYALYGIILYGLDAPYTLNLPKQAYFNDLTGPFINRNSMATYLAIISLLGAGLTLHHARYRLWLKAGLTVTGTCITTTALLLTHSRAGVVCFLITLFIGALLLCFSPAYRPWRQWLIGGIILIISLLLLTLAVTPAEHIARFILLSDDLTLRLHIFTTTWHGINATFPWGTGLGTFADVFPSFRHEELAFNTWKRITQAHNTYLELLLELGALAGLIFLSYALLLGQCLRGVLCRRQHTVYPFVACLSAIMAALHAVVDFSLEIPAIALTLCFLLGIGVAQSRSRQEHNA